MAYPKLPPLEKLVEFINIHAQTQYEYGSKGINAVLSDAQKSLKTCIAELEKLPVDANKAKNEPSDLATIKKLRPDGPRKMVDKIDFKKYRKRLAGAFTGRLAGCILGAPVEFWSVEKMEALAKENGDDFAPTDYWSYVYEPKRRRYNHKKSVVEQYTRYKMDGVPVDDDIAYTLLGLLILEEHGVEFSTDDIGKAWLKYLPFACSAEDMALKNLHKGIAAKKTATKNNPYCEWIGADIRSDAWGYVCPGWPEKAAQMAYNDAYISHRRQGIYGEMFFAATIAASFVVETPEAALQVGLSEIPRNCALAKAIRWALKIAPTVKNYRQARDAVDKKFIGMHGVHTINNACLSVFGLCIGGDDFTSAIGHTVAMGLDNDCTAATVGSIAGALASIDNIDDKWYKNFNDTIHSYLKGKTKFKISSVVNRFEKQAKKVWTS